MKILITGWLAILIAGVMITDVNINLLRAIVWLWTGTDPEKTVYIPIVMIAPLILAVGACWRMARKFRIDALHETIIQQHIVLKRIATQDTGAKQAHELAAEIIKVIEISPKGEPVDG